MSTYISSNANRFYANVEAAYGQAAPVTAANRFPAVRLSAHQSLETTKRMDKTGTRTFLGTPPSSRRSTAFEIRTYLTSWNGSGEPSYGALFHAAMGAPAQLSGGLIAASIQSSVQLQTSEVHGLSIGSAISYSNEIRFISAVPDPQTLVTNAPFSTAPSAGVALAPAVTYRLANVLPSVTIYDYWDPITAVSRIVTGAAVDVLTFSLNGDFHEFLFSGPAADLVDSASFVADEAGLLTYPVEPSLSAFNYSIVPGHLGQGWLGGTANQFFTLTGASFEVKNNVQTRNQEFGSSYPRSIAAGIREVATKFSLFAQDDLQTIALYTAAKQRARIPAMLQLGQQQGQLMGIFLPQIVPEIPSYNDAESQLQWDFTNNLAQGTANDEVYIAFA